MSAAVAARPVPRHGVVRHSVLRSLWWHLLPGVPVSAAALGGQPVAAALGLPAVASVFAAVVLVLVPLELGLLRWRLHREGRRLRALLRSVRRPTGRELARVVLPALAVQAAVYAVLWHPVEELTRRALFGWLPAAFGLADAQDPAAFAPAALAATAALGFVANGLLGPVVEELWFRGHLLPRLGHLGRWAPVLETAMFSAYHLFAPAQLVSRFVFALPLVAATWRTRSVAVGMVVHVVNNVVSTALLVTAYLR